jgi:hypothetical protein
MKCNARRCYSTKLETHNIRIANKYFGNVKGRDRNNKNCIHEGIKGY